MVFEGATTVLLRRMSHGAAISTVSHCDTTALTFSLCLLDMKHVKGRFVRIATRPMNATLQQTEQ